MVQILSVKELRRMRPTALETYKADVCLAILDAPTELEREPLRDQVHRVNSVLNNLQVRACR